MLIKFNKVNSFMNMSKELTKQWRDGRCKMKNLVRDINTLLKKEEV